MANFSLGDLLIGLRFEADQFFKGIDASSAKLNTFTKGIGSDFKRLADNGDLERIGRNLSLSVTAPLVLAAGASVKFSTDFNRSLANIATLIPGSTARVQELGESVRQIAVETGKSTTDISAGLYQIISAFGDSAESAKLLDINARAAAAGLATTDDAIALTSAVTKGYGDISAEAAQKAADLAFKTVELGQTTFPELASAMGKVIPIAAKLTVSQEELFGVMATLTGVTGSTAEVVTQVRGAMASLLKPTDDMAVAMDQLGFANAETLISSKGLVGALNAVISTTDGTSTSVGKLFANVESLPAVFALTGAQAETVATKTNKMTTAAGAATLAFREQTEGVNANGFAMQQATVKFEIAAQKIGEALAPSITKALDAVTPLIDAFIKLDPATQQAIVGVGALAAAFGPLLIVSSRLIQAWGVLSPVIAGISAGPIAAATQSIAGLVKSATGLSIALPLVTASSTAASTALGASGLAGSVTVLSKALPSVAAAASQASFPFAALTNSVGQLSLGLSGTTPLITGLGGAIPKLGTAVPATAAVTGLSAALPILGAAVGVAAAAFAAWQLEPVQQAVKKVWDVVVAVTTPLLDFGKVVGTVALQIANVGIDVLGEAFLDFGKSFTDVAARVAGAGLDVLLFLITDNTVKTIEAIANAVTWFITLGETIVQSAVNFEPLQVAIGKVVEILKLFGEIALTVVAVAIVGINKGLHELGEAAEKAKQFITTLVSAALEPFIKHLENMRAAAEVAKQFLITLVSAALAPLGVSVEKVQDTFDRFIELMVRGAELILGSWTGALDAVIGFLTRMLGALQSLPGVEAVLGDIHSAFDKLTTTATSTTKALDEIGPSMEELAGGLDKVTSSADKTTKPLSEFEKAVREAITKLEEQAKQAAINEEALRRYEAAINKGKDANVLFEKDVATAVKQLVEQERSQKVAAAAMQDYAAKVDVVVKSFERFDLKETLDKIAAFHKLLTNPPLIAYQRELDLVAKGADEAFKVFNKGTSPLSENAKAAGELGIAYEKLGVKSDQLARDELAALADALSRVRAAFEAGEASPEELARATEAYNDAADKAKGKTDSWGDALKQISTIITDFAKNISGNIVDLILGDRGEFNAQLDEQMNDLRTSLADATSELETSLADRATAYEDYVSEVKDAEQEIIANSAKKLSEELGKLRKSLADRQKAYDRYVSDVNKSLRRLTEDYERNLDEERKAVEEALSDRKRSYDRDVADAKKAHERKLADLTASLNAELAKGAEANQKRVADIRASIAREEEDYRISLTRKAEDFREFVDDQNTELAAFEEEQRIRHERATADQAAALEERTADHQVYTEEISAQMEEVTAKAKAEEAEKLAALSTSLAEQTAEYEAFKVEAAAKYEALKADIEGKLTEMESKHRTVLGDIGGLFKSLFEEAANAGLRFITEFLVNKLFNALKKDLKGALGSALDAFGGFFSAIGEGVKKLIGLFTGKGGLSDAINMSVPSGDMSIPGGGPSGGGSGAGSALGAVGPLGWASLAVDIGAAIVSGFQQMAMNKSLDLIVNHTLRIFNAINGGADGGIGVLGVAWKIFNEISFGTSNKAILRIADEIIAGGLMYINPSLDSIKQALWDILSALSGGVVIANGAAMVADGVTAAAPAVGSEVGEAVNSELLATPVEPQLVVEVRQSPARSRSGERSSSAIEEEPLPRQLPPRSRSGERSSAAIIEEPTRQSPARSRSGRSNEEVLDDVVSDIRAAFSESGTPREPAVIDDGQLSDLEKRWEELAEYGRATKEAAAANANSTAGMSAATIPLLTGIQTNTGLLAEGIASIGAIVQTMSTTLTDGFGLLVNTPVQLGEMLALTRTNLDGLLSIDTRLGDIQSWRSVLDGLAQMEPPTVNVSVFLDSDEISAKVETRIESNVQKAFA